jgi:hypothetical protein
MTELPAAVEEINTYRAAARKLVRNTVPSGPLSEREQYVAIIRLAEKARREAELPGMAQGAIWEECEGLLWKREPLPVPPDPVEAAMLKLHRRGYRRCPTCEQRIPGVAEFAAWAERRRLRSEEVKAKEAAIR